jgi:hypothetical protein
MKESSTYQAILQEGRAAGAVEEARKLLLRLGTKQLGQPSARTQAAVARIADLSRLEALIERLGAVNSWRALLTPSPADRT